MARFAISVDRLGKRYTIRHEAQRHPTLRDAIVETAARILKGSLRRPTTEDFWALREVSFTVDQGDVVGIVGRNGAGKSTLLKILSRITEPTEGSAEIRGRVRSLLEVGTGFHPELSGRENIYLNGTIMGMSRAEITRKFDEIVAFAEVERFIDTPVKRYSSGMYVRLAFAVAAHMEPEILLIDEVLAVGDADFQKKCLGKMGEVARGGRTVLFVSHNMGSIIALCPKTLFLGSGRLVTIGPTDEVVERYLQSLTPAFATLRDRTDRSGSGKARFVSVAITDGEGHQLAETLSGQRCAFVMGYEADAPLRDPVFKLTIYTPFGQPLLHCSSALVNAPLRGMPGSGQAICRIPRLPLSQGHYRCNISLEDHSELLDHLTGAFVLPVADGDFFGTGRAITGLRDLCLVDHDWQIDGRTEPPSPQGGQ
jgi:lipopolysaccharide transport system ATP-binding protein